MLEVGKQNSINPSLVKRYDYIAPLHIKLGLLKQFVMALKKMNNIFLIQIENSPV